MSEIKKYKKYLNFKANPRYLRRDFMVPLYTGTEPDIVPEASIEQQGAVQEFSEGGRAGNKDTVLNTYTKLKKDLGRNPSLAEMIRGTGKDKKTIYNYLGNKKLSEGRLVEAGKTGTAASVEAFKAKKVDKPTPTFYEGKLGVKWPDKETENRYIKQIKERYQYPAQSFEFNQKVKAGELLTDKALAKEFGINQANVERINKYIKNTEGLSYPKAEISEQEKNKRIRRKLAEKKSSDPAYEQKIRGTKETQKSHMGDLYNVKVTPQTIGYAPQEINLALTGKVDPALKSIIEKQNKLYKNKPENYKQRIEDLNVKGMDYAAQTEGYKVFEALDPKTGKRFVPITSPEKTIDPTGVAGSTPLKNLTKQQKAEIELNRKAVMEAQAKIPAAEKRRLVQMIGSIGCPTYAIGGRVNFSEGTDCYNKGLKKLEEGNLSKAELNVARRAITTAGEEGSFLKNILDKAGSGIKFTGVTFDDLMAFGRTPGGRLLGYGVGVGLPAYFAGEELLKGNIKQAGRELGYIPTLGFGLPESLVGSVKTDLIGHAKEKGFNVGSIEKILNKNEISKKINAAEELLGYGKEANLKNPEKFNKPIQDKIKSLYEEYDSIKLNNADQENLNKTLESFYTQNRERVPELFQARTKILENIQKDIGSFKRSELDPAFAQEEKINIPLEKIEEPVETVPEELPSEYKVSAAEGGYIDYMRDYNRYASGGRIHLNEGGGGPKLSRRGFLGFLAGAAASPFVIKAMKGKKLLSGAKVATKVLPKVAGMPDWFNPLVTRIMNEGVDISPKATRVEDIVKVKKLEFPMPEEGTKVFRKSGIGFEKKNIETITMTEYPDGRIEIEADVFGGSFDAPFSLNYRPPKTDINVETGEPVKYPGDFSVVEQRPKPDYGDPGNFEIDYEVMSVDDTISDLEKLEKIGTGKRIHPKRVEQRTGARKFVEDNPSEDIVNRYGDSEIEYDRMKDEGLFNETE
jgi:hypothetical protein